MTGRASSRERTEGTSGHADIDHTAFRASSVRTRSYDRDQVDAFVEEASREIARIRAENRELRAALRHSGPSKRELTAELEHLQKALAGAQQRARDVQADLDRTRAMARAEAPPSGEAPGDFVAMAQRFADQHVREAEWDAQALLSAARAKAGKMLGEAELLASTIDSDARARHTEAVGRLVTDRAVVREEVDRLTAELADLRTSLRVQMSREVPALLPSERM
ncbi:DivIVA domain-containing protein [Actinoplanes sp. CA-252034]|uniref:DivIVA domain-containing protein n=1 Tax=Actinoplanes sp. CA-252034 TaxID=3239906 RepID=UPI003D968B55